MSDGYGSRSPAQVVWLAAAAALVVVLLVGGGWLAWRGLATTPPGAGAAAGSPPSPAVAQAGFGAPRVVDGVPWGFPLTVEGAAAAAATAVAISGQAQVVFDAARFDEVAAVIFTPEQAAEQARQVDAARTEFELSGWAAQPPSRRTYHFAPLAVRPVAFDVSGPGAVVEVWAMTLVGVGDAGGAVFTTTTVELAADGETWTVAGLDTVAGPTPLIAEVASAPGRVRALVRDAIPLVPLPAPHR